MQEGKVKFFNETKGFGDNVSYEVEQGRKGLNAVNVRVI